MGTIPAMQNEQLTRALAFSALMCSQVVLLTASVAGVDQVGIIPLTVAFAIATLLASFLAFGRPRLSRRK